MSRLCMALCVWLLAGAACAGDGMSGKLLQTGGLSELEGAGGGGLTPWALITGYGTRDQIGANAHVTQVRLSDFRFSSSGAAVGWHDRLELSIAEQRLRADGPRPFTLAQDVLGLKLRVFGQTVYDQDSWKPQVAVGLQLKQNDQAGDGTDVYVSVTKLSLAHSVLLNGTLRWTDANQMGLLGFGGGRELVCEGSAAWLPTRHTAVGVEYRELPHGQDPYRDVFCALYPSKNLSLTFAYVDMGAVGGLRKQDGAYVSLQAGF